MSRNAALLLVLIFLTVSSLIAVKPVLSSDNAENSWTSKAPMHTARAYLGVAVVNGKIYAIGGDTDIFFGGEAPESGRGYNVVSTNEEYDPASDTWTTKASMPTARALFGTAVYQNEIYCIGGYFSTIVPYNGTYGPELNITYHDSGENKVYNPVTNNWKSKAPMPTPRYFAATTMLNGKIYVFGGDLHLNVTEVYDIEIDSWAEKSPAPLPVEGGVSAAVVDERIYVLGVSAKDQAIMEVYNPLNDSWTVGNPAPVSITSTAVTTSGLIAPQRIYFFGENSTGIYDAATNDWATGAPEPTERLIGVAAAINDLIYLIGGRSGENGQITLVSPVTPSALNEQYTPLGYGTTRPVVSTVSPENKTYNESSVPLTFTVDKPVSWMGYSLDGQDNVSIAGNTTLTELPNGAHNLTVYAKYTEGSIGASENIAFTIAEPEPEPFPIVPVAVASGASAIAIAAGLLIYFKKFKRRQ